LAPSKINNPEDSEEDSSRDIRRAIFKVGHDFENIGKGVKALGLDKK